MVLEKVIDQGLEADQLEQLRGIRETLLAKLRDTGDESKHSRWEHFKNIFPLTKSNSPLTTDRLYPTMTIVNLKGEWKGKEVEVKIFAGASKLQMLQAKGEIDYPISVNVTMDEQRTNYFLTPDLCDSLSYRSYRFGGVESCLELGQLTELIKTGGLQVVHSQIVKNS